MYPCAYCRSLWSHVTYSAGMNQRSLGVPALGYLRERIAIQARGFSSVSPLRQPCHHLETRADHPDPPLVLWSFNLRTSFCEEADGENGCTYSPFAARFSLLFSGCWLLGCLLLSSVQLAQGSSQSYWP